MRKVIMEKLTLELPAMYGDHHVIEVRRLLLEIPGVVEVYASSAFQLVEVTYDPAKVNDLEIKEKLDNAGYLGEWSMVMEPAIAVSGRKGEQDPFFRHTTVYEQTRQNVSFAQDVAYAGRPLWPCPGMGIVKGMHEEE
jgi:copper chaperone CopZ